MKNKRVQKLKNGAKAPTFSVADQNGDVHSLSDYAGRKVALYFYPQDNTLTCTEQACNLRDNFAKLKKKGVVILGVSGDSVKKHKNFEKKYSLPFTLLADTERKIINDYGVWGPKKLFGRDYMGIYRTTFLIDENGKIAHIIDDVDAKDHAQQIIDTWGL